MTVLNRLSLGSAAHQTVKALGKRHDDTKRVTWEWDVIYKQVVI